MSFMKRIQDKVTAAGKKKPGSKPGKTVKPGKKKLPQIGKK